KRLRKFQFGAREVKPTANPDYVIIKPVTEARMGVFDVRRAAVVTGLDKADATMWGGLLALESVNGKVLLREVSYDEGQKTLNYKEAGTVELPVGAIGGARPARRPGRLGSARSTSAASRARSRPTTAARSATSPARATSSTPSC